ncbi:MAG: hypothetical protein AAF568_10020, partial [Pseudomonadota bacterium]
ITKQRRAIIRTPTATIGIRGGLVIIEVSEDGTTRVTQMAGESTTVQSYGDSDGDGVDDGPTGDELETFLDGGDVSGGGRITLSRSGAVAQTGGGTQTGQGQGGAGEPKTVTYEGLTTPEELEDAYNSFEGSRTGGNPNPPSNPQVVIATQEIVPLNSEQPGGANTPPVSTSGESQPTFVSGSEPIETNPVTSGDAPESIETNDAFNDIIDGNDGGGQVADGIPSGGSILSATLGFDPFVSIQAGSLIGTTLAGDVITLNTPTDSSGFLNVDDANFFAFQRFQNAGLFLLDSSTSSSQDLGPLTGVGFADLDNEFYFAIAVPTGGASEPFVALLGDNTPNQNGFFDANPALPDTTNAVTGYVVEPDLIDLEGNQEQLFIVQNGGTDGAQSGSRVLLVDLQIEDGLNGFGQQEREESFGVIAGPVTQGATGGPVISTTFVGATNFQQGSFQEFTFEQANLGTIEDIEGHTLFGPNGDYIGFSSGFRPNGTGAFVTNQPGFETFVSPTTSTFIDAAEGIVTFATNDPNLSSQIADPLPLAGITASRASAPGQFDSVLATGFVACSANRSCGANNSKLYALTPNFFGGDQSTAGNIEFQQGA